MHIYLYDENYPKTELHHGEVWRIWNYTTERFDAYGKLYPKWCVIPLWFGDYMVRDLVNSLRPRQNGRLSADDILKRIFLNENIRISTKNSLKFVPKGPLNNIPALVLIMAWRRPGDRPLSEPMLVRSLTHICVTRPQWGNCGCAYTIYYKRLFLDMFIMLIVSSTYVPTST